MGQTGRMATQGAAAAGLVKHTGDFAAYNGRIKRASFRFLHHSQKWEKHLYTDMCIQMFFVFPYRFIRPSSHRLRAGAAALGARAPVAAGAAGAGAGAWALQSGQTPSLPVEEVNSRPQRLQYSS